MSNDHEPSFPDDWDDYGEDCANCGGEGFVAHCFQEFACVYPDLGCDLCMSRCDWCNPAPNKSQPPTGGRMDE